MRLGTGSFPAYHAPRALALVAALIALAATPGCYLAQAAYGQYRVNAARRPISRVLEDPSTPQALRSQLGTIVQLRDYASHSLALPDNASYRAYADVGRPYVVWNVFAAPAYSVEPVTWCFPVAGCVAYRGYFDETRARDYALGLRARGYDVLVGGVPAYSTLGHFADPVLNTMVGWDEADLAALLFHELAHQVAYAKDDTAFNEAFATTVEREGVRRWFASRHDEAALAAYEQGIRRRAVVAQLLGQARERLARLYAQGGPEATLRAAKRAELARLRESYEELRARGDLDAGYSWLFGPQLNNAALLAVATYEDCVPAFADLLASTHADLPAFYARVRELAQLPRDERHRALGAAVKGTCR